MERGSNSNGHHGADQSKQCQLEEVALIKRQQNYQEGSTISKTENNKDSHVNEEKDYN
jgi:hypothetical protein